MQRFKDFTKKSGKVASAILSAAMVTSMVAGTNVVYAATEATEATPDVTGTTVNSEVTVARAAKNDIIAAVKDFPVNAATTKNEEGFEKALKTVREKYDLINNTTGAAITDLKVTKAPSDTKDGEAVLTFVVTAGGFTENGEVTYPLDSYNKRAAIMQKAIEEKLADLPISNSVTTGSIMEAVLDLKDKKDKDIKLYSDFNVTGSAIEVNNFKIDEAKKNQTGSVSADILVPYLPSNALKAIDLGAKGVDAKVTLDKTIASNQDRADAAAAAAKKYLQNDVRALNTADVTTNSVIELVLDYLQYDYPDAGITDDQAAPVEVKVINKASQTVDGSATAKFRVTVANGTESAYADVDTTEITLLSDESKANKALADLMAIAEKLSDDVDGDTEKYTSTPDNYDKSYEKLFDDKINDKKEGLKKFVTTSGSLSVKNNTSEIENFEYLYGKATNGTDAKATLEFTAKDASADKDGNPKVIFTVTVGNEKVTQTYTYTVKSAQSTVDAAKVAVDKALADMTVTNDTTRDDVEAVVKEALKDYPDVKTEFVTFELTKASADKEGTLNVKVKLTDTKDGVTKEAGVDKTFAFYCNTFVEKDGKKYYYGKDGKLATTDKGYFLQGTDSPDGYTYFIQNDGSVMQDRLTYHPDGEHVIYFDKDGHEVFDAFVNVKKDALGNPVDYIGYFDTFGYAYTNQTTYGNGEGAYAADALFYINDYGVLENKGWFQNAAGEIGYAATNGTLTTSQWSLDQFGRKVYFQANGFLAKGLMTDGVKYYQLDETDGHLVGEF